MAVRVQCALRGALSLLAAVAIVPAAWGTGEIGEHVKDLKPHIEQYERDVNRFVERIDALVNAYANGGADAVDPDKLVEWWEDDLMYHEAVEVHYTAGYAKIWQGISGLQQALQKGEPVAKVREHQARLVQALWQGLGAVKMAAVHQQREDGNATPAMKAPQPDTISEIQANLDRVLDRYRRGQREQAKELVHDTYLQLFEGIEGELIERDADLVVALEKDFNVTLPQALEAGGPAERVATVVADMKDKLDRAQGLLEEARKNRRSVF